MTQRLLLITPAHNEEARIEMVAEAVAAQTRRPDVWIIVDDESDDRTPDLLAALAARYDFIEPRNTRELPRIGPVDDRLATAAEARAFNLGLASVDRTAFTHIAKLDGDTELPPEYFERLLGEFARDTSLGLAGGVYADPDPSGEGWRPMPIPVDYHVPGTLKCYTLECFEAIGGMQERLGWDTIDETYARMRGYRTRAFPELVAHHHRPWGSADGTLRGRARLGECAWVAQFPLSWICLRALKIARLRPRGLSGLAFVYGYLRSAWRRVPRVDDPAYRRFVHRELRARAADALRGRSGARTATGPLAAADSAGDA
jgi:glycosyltransferase involved in cell wall biosynthesis